MVLLGVLAAVAGLGTAGWTAGLAVGAAGLVALAVAARRSGVSAFGPADLVTLGRAVLVVGVTALVADGSAPVPLLVALAAVALSLDAVDGRLARRTGTVSAFGARFDMEVDAFLILILSVHVAGDLGPWVLVIGLMRYGFVAAGWTRGWLRAPLPVSLFRKTVAAAQGIVLVVAASGVLGTLGSVVVVGAALVALVWSFGRDLLWLREQRVVEPKPATPLRRALAAVATGLACALVLFALLAPNDLSRYTPVAFARLPVEAILVAGLVLVLPPRPRAVAAVAAGAGLGLLTIVKLFDLGFNETLARPFDPVFDWTFLGPGLDFLRGSAGGFVATMAVVGAVALALGLVGSMVWSVLRLSRIVVGHRTRATRTVLVFGLVWAILAMFEVRIVPHVPVAARSAASAAYQDVRQIRAGLLDPARFTKEAADDDFRHTPGSELLTALRGKDVLVTFVESYGRVAVEDSAVAADVDAVLDAGTDRLRAAGFDSRSAFLESSTSGGGSWFAHATLQSGLWINNQHRYDALTASDRLTLSNAFRRAGWRTVGVAPAISRAWPEGGYFGFEQIYDAHNVGYEGPRYAYAKMPDQYTLAHFERAERDRPEPVMAEIDLVSSHSPFAPLPTLVDWDEVGDGSVFDPQPAAGTKGSEIWPDPVKVTRAYGDAIEYSLSTLVSYVETHGDDDLVLVVVGDHQPAPIVTGDNATWDVPITVIAKDPAVLDRIDHWHWQPGMNPSENAPVWRMDSFRDRFLRAFGPRTEPSSSASGR
ncbi:CDP-alcohol phosphatidyltransferase family protein [Actinophytocola gossypii]|uniref:CDP-alcohol phosphatidyltransferase family protein n=1 Tax=Actinophytocola gossypii TaxID=2812003 RepID=UPI0035CD3CB3